MTTKQRPIDETMINDEGTFGCDDCIYLKGHRCKLWEAKIDDPHDSHCDSANVGQRE